MLARMGSLDLPRSCFAFLIGALAFLAEQPGAAAQAAAANCKFESLSEVAASGRLKQILDGRSFLLEDGREVRLAGIEVPLATTAVRDTPGQPAAQASRAALERLLAGVQLSLKRLGSDSDRYGRLLAHVFVERDGGQVWLQRELVAQGHALVTARLDATCAKELLNAERTARAAGLGLWADGQFRARAAEKPEDILSERGRFTLVEGKVLSVRESGGTVYLNFGRRWTRDFAVTVLKRNERLFAAAGLELKKLEGRRVRIRGWVEERGGPRIEAQGPEQIEIADRN
jgi:endonuclease YncB( thermonuclease family)